MGVAIASIANEFDAEISNAIDVGDSADRAMDDCDAVIDFSYHAVTPGLVELAAESGKPVVIGTTGFTDEEKARIVAVSKRLPVVLAGNYSVGVNLMNYLVGKAAELLPSIYHPEVIEMHHRHKKDAPSGTAERLIEIVREARSLSREQERHGRKGITGERPDDEIGIHALRGGDVVGEHTVMFAGPGERLEITHKAADRRIFAQGAIRAAHWLTSQPAGMYDMQDVLGLK